jgi:hypothetical protein
VKASTTQNLTIQLATGTYNAAGGEIFPIVVPVGTNIVGTAYGAGPFRHRGSFVDGVGEDTSFEQLAGTASKRAFATFEVAQDLASPVSLTGVYVGASRLSIPAGATYASVDALGPLSASHVTFAAGMRLTHPRVAGVLVPSGTFTCTACTIFGSDFALVALALPNAIGPSVNLTGQPAQSTIGGDIGILTDSTASIDASFQTFASKHYAYRDNLAPIASPFPGTGSVDFGHGDMGSQGGNLFIGAARLISEISLSAADAHVIARADTWNASTQGTNAQGQYPRERTFRPGTSGRNVTVAAGANGASVEVGPYPPATPTPPPTSPTPSSGPTPTPGPT